MKFKNLNLIVFMIFLFGYKPQYISVFVENIRPIEGFKLTIDFIDFNEQISKINMEVDKTFFQIFLYGGNKYRIKPFETYIFKLNSKNCYPEGNQSQEIMKFQKSLHKKIKEYGTDSNSTIIEERKKLIKSLDQKSLEKQISEY